MAKKSFKQRSFRPKPDPDADWNAVPTDWKGAIETAERILSKLKAAPSRIWDKAFDYFRDVERKAGEIKKTIEDNRRASDKQVEALNRWEAGVDKWLKPKQAAGDTNDSADDSADDTVEENFD